MHAQLRTCIAIWIAILTLACSTSAENLFVGTFESETRENFGSDTPGEYRIEVVATSNGKYLATFYYRDTKFGERELVSCPVESLDYFRNRPAGRAEVLCSENDIGVLHGVLGYSENGIYVAGVKQKYVRNPELVRQEGLKPGDPSLFERRHHKARYYAHIKWVFYGFRKAS